jgi:hypothetical protein
VQTRTRSELGFTLGLLVTVLAAASVPSFRAPALAASFVALEIVGRLVGRPTQLLVAVYGALLAAAVVVDWMGPRLPARARPVGWVLAASALLGLGYTLVFAALLNGPVLACALGAGFGGWLLGRRGRAAGATAEREGPPTLALFVFVHLLVEATAGHLVNRWLHPISAGLSVLSEGSPWTYGLVFGVAAALVILVAIADTARRSWVVGAGLIGIVTGGSVAVSPEVGSFLAAVLLATAVGFGAGASGRRLIDWAHYNPSRLAARLGPVGLIALGCVGAHYAGTMWRCPPGGAPGLTRLATDPGAFSLATSADGSVLVASLRERQELLLIDRSNGSDRRISLASSADTLFDRAEPETLLALNDGRVLVLVAASDGERGNQLRVLEPRTATLTAPLPSGGAGVSDIVDDGSGAVWVSTEYEGLLKRMDLASGSVAASLEIPDSETNKILVDSGTRRAWSVGLWWDDRLRVVDLDTGVVTASAFVGTHQWDLARSTALEQVFVPKFLTGWVEGRRADTLEFVQSWRAGFGVRAIEADDARGLVVTGGLYGGDLSGWEMGSGAERFRYHIGGHVKAVAVSEHGIFAAGNCGIFETKDSSRW